MTSEASLAGKIAVVTGGAAGIGAACCKELVHCGVSVAIADRDLDAATALAREIGGSAKAYRCDVTSPADMEALPRKVADHFGRLDIAVNNAGIAGVLAPLPDYPLEMWNQVIATNLTGVFLGMKSQIPLMVEQRGGAIINIASILGLVGAAGTAAYAAAKHGVAGLTKVAALEWGEAGIRINAVAPSYIRTSLTLNALPEEMWTELSAMHALKRCAEPEEVARFVAWLASPAASFVTGGMYPIDGGYTSA